MITRDTNNYDVIVIGSGIGGLAAASLLAQVGKRRVLVLEKHFKLGGFTHAFRRKQWEWDVGVHYVGEMHEGALTRGVMDLVTRRGVQWNSMGGTVERVCFPEGTFEYPNDPAELEERLIFRFPNQQPQIRQYFKDVKRAQSWVARWFVSKIFSAPLSNLITMGSRRLSQQTTAEYLSRFSDPLLKAILAAQWPDYGSPPSESAFGIHATVTADYFRGGYYPVGGSGRIAEQSQLAIESAGGLCLVNHAVEEIVCEGSRAVGVRAAHKGQSVEFRAPVVISDAGAINTFQKLVPDSLGHLERQVAARAKHGTSALMLFLGLKDDPRNYGFDAANYWVFDRLDHESRTTETSARDVLIEGAFLSFGSIRDPLAKHHTAQIISFSQKSAWAEFGDKPWLRRGAEYEARKSEISQRMIDFIEQRVPGVTALIEYHELATPLTVESFTSHPDGMIYGQACDVNRLTRDQWKVKTSVKNLYLTGSDVGSPGVNGALMGAVMTAAKVLGPFGLPRIMSRAQSK